MQVIQPFLKNNAKTCGIDGNFGILAKGEIADLLALAKNPLDGIASMRTLEAIQAAENLGNIARRPSAADLKFLQRLLQTRLGTSNRKAALES